MSHLHACLLCNVHSTSITRTHQNSIGIWLTSKLGWTPHINKILKKVDSSLSLNFYRRELSIQETNYTDDRPTQS